MIFHLKMKTKLLLILSFAMCGAVKAQTIQILDKEPDHIMMSCDKDSTIYIHGDTVKQIRLLFRDCLIQTRKFKAANELLSFVKIPKDITSKSNRKYYATLKNYWLLIGDKRYKETVKNKIHKR